MSKPSETLTCPRCGQAFPPDAELVGRRVRCRCGEVFTLGAPTPPPDPDPIELDASAIEPVGPESVVPPSIPLSPSIPPLLPTRRSLPPTESNAPSPQSPPSPSSPSQRLSSRSFSSHAVQFWPPAEWPPWVGYMVIGIVCAPIVTFTPYLMHAGWILSAIIHEGGHTIYSWVVGCPAAPAINLTGHALTISTSQQPLIVLIVMGLLIWLLVEAFRRRTMRPAAIALLVLYPLFAYQPTLKALGHLLSGHLAELLIGGIFLWQARTGLFTHDKVDRAAYAIAGWYLVFSNAWLCFGLAFVPSRLQTYYTSGSYGLTNDYVRAADHLLHVSIKAVVLPMCLFALLVPALALWTARYLRGAEE